MPFIIYLVQRWRRQIPCFFSDQQSKTQQYLYYYPIWQRNAAIPEIYGAETKQSLAFMLKKWREETIYQLWKQLLINFFPVIRID